MQIRKIYYMLHIASHHYYPLVKIHLYQNYFNASCHWYMNMYCLIKLCVNMLTLFKRLLIEDQMSMQKMKMEKCLLHLACENNHDKIISILCIVPNFLFIYLLVSYIINFTNLCDFFQLCKYYVAIICKNRKKGTNMNTYYELGQSNENVIQTQNKNETNYRIKNIKIVFSSCKLWFLWNICCHASFMFHHAHPPPASLWFALI